MPLCMSVCPFLPLAEERKILEGPVLQKSVIQYMYVDYNWCPSVQSKHFNMV